MTAEYFFFIKWNFIRKQKKGRKKKKKKKMKYYFTLLPEKND